MSKVMVTSVTRFVEKCWTTSMALETQRSIARCSRTTPRRTLLLSSHHHCVMCFPTPAQCLERALQLHIRCACRSRGRPTLRQRRSRTRSPRQHRSRPQCGTKKKRMLRKLGWMEAVVKTKVGTHHILLRKGLQAVQDCLSWASTVRCERGSDECTCAAGVCYTPNASHVWSDADSQDGADAATSRLKGSDVHPRTATPTTACAMCTPSVSEGGDVPDTPVLQDADVLRDIFDGRAYWAQRADVNHVFGLRALMLALALYSDGTVVTSSGGTFSHIPASFHCAC